MNKSLSFIVSMFLIPSAFAQTGGLSSSQSSAQSQSNSSSLGGNASSTAIGLGLGGNANAYGGSGGAGGIGGQAFGGNGGTSDNALSLSLSSPHQAPSVLMGSLFPTAPCQGAANGFLSTFFFGGIGGGSSFTLDQCEVREEARMLNGMGRADLALQVMCMAKYTSRLPICREWDDE